MVAVRPRSRAALHHARYESHPVEVSFAVVQVERDAGAVGVDVAVGFARLPGGGKDGFAQGAFPVGAGDFALAVARQAVGDADMARHGEAVVLLQEQGAPAGE